MGNNIGFNLTESLTTGEREVAKIYEAANHAGLDVVKLVWSKKGKSIPQVMGFDVPTATSTTNVNPLDIHSSDEGMVNLQFGQVRFYPDANDFRWGYVIATERNLECMMNHIPRGWYVVHTKSYREKIIKMAEAAGLPTSYVRPKSEHVKKTVREEQAEQKITEMAETEKELRAQLAQAQADLETAREDARNEVIAETLAETPAPENPGPDDVVLDEGGAPIVSPEEESKEKSKKSPTRRKGASRT